MVKVLRDKSSGGSFKISVMYWSYKSDPKRYFSSGGVQYENEIYMKNVYHIRYMNTYEKFIYQAERVDRSV